MKLLKYLSVGLLSIAFFSSFSNSANAQKYIEPNYEKIYGSDRFDTSIKLSEKTYNHSDNIILVNPDKVEDLIDSFNASIHHDAPIILYSSAYHSHISDEIKRLSSKNIYTNEDVNFENGSNKALPKFYDYDIKSVVLVSNYIDGIVATSYASNTNKTMVLINDENRDSILNKLKKLKVQDITIVGGKKSIPDINDKYFYVKRIAGNNRYETSKLLVDNIKNNNVILTSGETAIDALASNRYAKKNHASILLSNNDASNTNVHDYNVKAIVGGALNVKMNIFYLVPHQDDEVLQIGIDIYRDVQKGHNVNAVLFTDGSKTGALEYINDRLDREGFPRITNEDISTARNKEFDLAMHNLGVSTDKIQKLGYINRGLLKSDVSIHLENILSIYKNNVVFKTLSEEMLVHMDGSSDHIAITNATEEMEKKYNTPACYYINSRLLNHIFDKRYQTIRLTPEEEIRMKNALYAYLEWKPEKGFYSVGGFSVPSYFYNKIKYPVYYLED